MKMYRDTENGDIITEAELRAEFNGDAERIEEYGTFQAWLENCTNKNGFLEFIGRA